MQFLNKGWGLPRGWWAVPWLSMEKHHQSWWEYIPFFFRMSWDLLGSLQQKAHMSCLMWQWLIPTSWIIVEVALPGVQSLSSYPGMPISWALTSAHDMEEERHVIKGLPFRGGPGNPSAVTISFSDSYLCRCYLLEFSLQHSATQSICAKKLWSKEIRRTKPQQLYLGTKDSCAVPVGCHLGASGDMPEAVWGMLEPVIIHFFIQL